MATHPVTWQAPQPLWARFGATTAAAAGAADQARPAILRFAADDFMEKMLGTLARDPSRLGALIARPETWRAPMTETADLVEHTPIPALARSSLRKTIAREPKAALAATVSEAEVNEQKRKRTMPLKLYQPAHQRFYVVGASLVCAQPGWPERAVVPGAVEQVSFVIRRLMPVSGSGDLREFAYVKDANAARWVRVTSGTDDAVAVAGEELLPLFPLAYHDDSGRERRLWGGLVPVGRREEYMGVKVDTTPAPAFADGQRQSLDIQAPATPMKSRRARMTQFQMEVAEPWKNLVRSAYKAAASFVPTTGAPSEPAGKTASHLFGFNLQQQHASWLVLLDFADFLDAYLPDVSAAVNNPALATSLLGARKELYDRLEHANMPPALVQALVPPVGGLTPRTPSDSLRAALAAVRATGVREGLEAVDLTYTGDPASFNDGRWPKFHFVLAGLNTNLNPDGPFVSIDSLTAKSADDVLPDPTVQASVAQTSASGLDQLSTRVSAALDATLETDAPPLPFALQLRDAIKDNVSDAGWFAVRFVYTRRDCGPLHPPLLSAPTQRFQLANFFDPDAPARPVRITLPLDISPAGMRKFNKNTAFIISDMLCGQIQRAKGLGLIDLVLSVLPWPLHKDLDVGTGGPCSVNIGMICSLSIPIITICALILLIIFVSLFDLIFHWLPFFIMCFPIPGLKGKK
jgi:hypothetical protein